MADPEIVQFNEFGFDFAFYTYYMSPEFGRVFVQLETKQIINKTVNGTSVATTVYE